jgi:hypothetical protein
MNERWRTRPFDWPGIASSRQRARQEATLDRDVLAAQWLQACRSPNVTYGVRHHSTGSVANSIFTCQQCRTMIGSTLDAITREGLQDEPIRICKRRARLSFSSLMISMEPRTWPTESSFFRDRPDGLWRSIGSTVRDRTDGKIRPFPK